jgi:serine/threonine-protein kinase RsbW
MKPINQPVMKICEKDPSITIIETVEDLDLYSAVKLKEYFSNLCSSGWYRFIIDLSHTKYLDSSGLGALIHMYTSTKKDDNVVIQFANISPTISKVIKLTRLEGMFHISNDVDTAIKNIHKLQPGNRLMPPHSQATTTVPEVRDIKIIPSEKEKEQKKDDERKKEREERVHVKEIHNKEQLTINEHHTLFNREGLKYMYIQLLNLEKIRKASAAIVLEARGEIKETNMLEHQIYEILYNAYKHGNKGKMWKSIKVWYYICSTYAHIIVQDEGKGFKKLEEWNDFYRQRMNYFKNRDFTKLKKYLSFKTEKSSSSDKGIALFSAIEYWNGGIVFNNKRNTVAVKRIFP